MEQSDIKLIQAIPDQQERMIELLHQFCNINSYSDNLPGLALMLDCLQQAFSPIADSIEVQKLPPVPYIDLHGNTQVRHCGDALLIQKRPQLKRRILLAGHMDTVYPLHSSFQKIRYLNAEQINGPGVCDMKGGLIVILHALATLEQSQAKELIGWDVLINADEEIGSEASSALFTSRANLYQAALLYEPAMDSQGTLAKNRKGNGKFTIVSQGKAAHAGRNFVDGKNAICYLAEVIGAVNALNGKRPGVTINVGLIAGGEALNVVPAKAVAKLDVRISEQEDSLWVINELEQIKQKYQKSEYGLHIEGAFGRPVKKIDKGSERLFTRLKGWGKELGLNLDWKDSGGCCDGNNLSQYGIPILDTLGVRGGNIHSEQEFIELASLAERTALSALLLIDLATGGLEDLHI